LDDEAQSFRDAERSGRSPAASTGPADSAAAYISTLGIPPSIPVCHSLLT